MAYRALHAQAGGREGAPLLRERHTAEAQVLEDRGEPLRSGRGEIRKGEVCSALCSANKGDDAHAVALAQHHFSSASSDAFAMLTFAYQDGLAVS